MKRYVVTNHRFTEQFRHDIAESLFSATPSIFLECEEMTFDDAALVTTFEVTIDHIGNIDGAFFALGHTDTCDLRIESELGTLYVSTP